MANPFHHALSSARKYGGRWQDFILIHSWMDQSKSIIADGRHRALRHHAEGITMCEAVFGTESRRASDGTIIPVRTIAEQHVLEDFGFIPDAKQWLSLLPLQPWMTRHRPRGPEEANGEQREQCEQGEQCERQGGFAEYPSVARHAIASARRYGGVPEDYLTICW